MKTKRFVGILLLMVLLMSIIPVEALQVFAMQVYVSINVDTGEEQLSFQAESSDTIGTLKIQIEAETGIAPDGYYLYYNGTPFPDGMSLSVCGIPDGSTLQMAVAVMYNSNEDSSSYSNDYFLYNVDTALVGPNFSRAGYRLVGWNTESDGSGVSYSVGQTVHFTQNISLYAQWEEQSQSGEEAVSVQITYRNEEGGYNHHEMSLDPEDTVGDIKSRIQSELGIDSEVYCIMFGGNLLEDDTKTVSELGISDDSNLILVTALTYMMNYDDVGKGEEGIYDINYPIPLTSFVQRTGYRLVSWNTEPDGSGISYEPGESYVLYGHTVLYAQWRELVNPITVTFLVADSVLDDTATYNMEIEAAETIASVEARLHKETLFDAGEFYLVYNNEELTEGSRTVSEIGFQDGDCLYVNVVLTFMRNDGSDEVYSESHIRYNTSICLPTDITRNGYVFAGWNTSSDGNGISYGVSTSTAFTSNTVLYAQWTKSGAEIAELVINDIVAPVPGDLPSYSYSLVQEGITAGDMMWYRYNSSQGDYVLMESDETFLARGSYKAVIPLTLDSDVSFPDPCWNVTVSGNTQWDFSNLIYNDITARYECEIQYNNVGIVALDLSNIVVPVAEEEPRWDWTPLDTHVEVRLVEWRDENIGNFLNSGDVFQKGHIYSQIITIALTQGYLFGWTHSYPSEVLGIESTNNDAAGTVVVTLRYATEPDESMIPLSNVSFSGVLNVPVAGEAATVGNLSVNDGYAITDAYWICNGTNAEEHGTFLAAHSYRLRIVLAASEGYSFSAFNSKDGIYVWNSESNKAETLKTYLNEEEKYYSSIGVISEEDRTFFIEFSGYTTDGYGENLLSFSDLIGEGSISTNYAAIVGEQPSLDIVEFDRNTLRYRGTSIDIGHGDPFWSEISNPHVDEFGFLSFENQRPLEDGEVFQSGKYYMWAGYLVPVDSDLYEQAGGVYMNSIEAPNSYMTMKNVYGTVCETTLIFQAKEPEFVLKEELEVAVDYEPKIGEVPRLDIASFDTSRFHYSSEPFWSEVSDPHFDTSPGGMTYINYSGQRMLQEGDTFEAGKYYMWAGYISPIDSEIANYQQDSGFYSDFIQAPSAYMTGANFYWKKLEAMIIFYVEDPNHLVTVSSTPVGYAYGQGIYETGETVTVGVDGVDPALYDFNGWYNGASFLSSSMTYIFTMGKEDLDLRAVFSSKEGAKTTVDVSADSFEISLANSEQYNGIVQEVDLGTTVVVSYTGEEENFLYWQNEGNKIVSTDTTYEFTVGSQVSISAVTVGDSTGSQSATSKVMFLSAYNQILSMDEYGPDSVIIIPGETTKLGYTFVGWSVENGEAYSVSEIGGAIREYLRDSSHLGKLISVRPVFEQITGTYTVTVQYSGVERESENTIFESVGTYSLAAPAIDGYVLSCWKSGEEVISTSTSCPVYVDSDLIITAVFVAESECTVTAVPTIYHAGVVRKGFDSSIGKYRMTYLEMYDVPEGFTLVEHGVLYTADEALATENDLVLGSSSIGNGVVKKTSVLKDPMGSYGMTFKVSTTSEPRYVRAYLTYKDSDGTIHDIYTDVKMVVYGED